MRIIVLAAAALSACTNILHADFDTDPVGAPPVAAPPSAANDAVEAFPGPGAVLVSAASPLNGTRSLELTGPSGNSTPSAIFHSAPVPNGAEPVWVQWRMDTNGFIATEARLFANFSDQIIRLNFEDGIVFVDGNSEGTYGFNPFGVIIGLFPDDGEYTLALTGDAQTDVENHRGALLDPSTLPAGHLSLRIDLDDADPSIDRLTLDEVRMNQRNP